MDQGQKYICEMLTLKIKWSHWISIQYTLLIQEQKDTGFFTGFYYYDSK